MSNEKKNRVVVGLSGGVDSSVAAYLLKEQGYEVTGLFMINWHETTGTLAGDCPWNDDLIFAQLVARKLDIPFHSVDLSDQYRKRVVDYMFAEYEKGRTPNPDVLCNREIKFDIFVDKARELGADFVATGHYCKKDEVVKDGQTYYRLLAGDDPNKEQSYFLCQLSQEQLKMALFPIGAIHKPEIRRIAGEQDLATATRKDSQGICFVGKVDLPAFLQQKLKPKRGEIIEIPAEAPVYQPVVVGETEEELNEQTSPYYYLPEMGEVAGSHMGAHFYTIGQRKGLNVGGKPEPLFVIATDIDRNVIYTGQGKMHPGLFRKGLFVRKEELHWVRPDLEMVPGEERDYQVRIRYRQPLQQARLFCREEGMYIIFEDPQRGIAAGQFAAWYDDGEVIGSGVINA